MAVSFIGGENRSTQRKPDFWKETAKEIFGQNLVSLHPMVMKKFSLFNQLEAIVDVSQGHQMQFWKMSIQRVALNIQTESIYKTSNLYLIIY